MMVCCWRDGTGEVLWVKKGFDEVTGLGYSSGTQKGVDEVSGYVTSAEEMEVLGVGELVDAGAALASASSAPAPIGSVRRGDAKGE